MASGSAAPIVTEDAHSAQPVAAFLLQEEVSRVHRDIRHRLRRRLSSARGGATGSTSATSQTLPVCDCGAQVFRVPTSPTHFGRLTSKRIRSPEGAAALYHFNAPPRDRIFVPRAFRTLLQPDLSSTDVTTRTRPNQLQAPTGSSPAVRYGLDRSIPHSLRLSCNLFNPTNPTDTVSRGLRPARGGR